jgi:hypothetical protein
MASGRAHAAPNTVRSPLFAFHLARETYLTLGDITHMASLIISEGNHRRSSSLTCTKLKQRIVGFEDGNAGVGSSKINSDDATHTKNKRDVSQM